jgi:hypothetical protein
MRKSLLQFFWLKFWNWKRRLAKMAEITEKVELIKFDQEKYLAEGEMIYALRGEVEALADEVAKAGYSNIILLNLLCNLSHFCKSPFPIPKLQPKKL